MAEPVPPVEGQNIFLPRKRAFGIIGSKISQDVLFAFFLHLRAVFGDAFLPDKTYSLLAAVQIHKADVNKSADTEVIQKCLVPKRDTNINDADDFFFCALSNGVFQIF